MYVVPETRRAVRTNRDIARVAVRVRSRPRRRAAPRCENTDLAKKFGAQAREGFLFLTVLDEDGHAVAEPGVGLAREVKDENGEPVLGDKMGHDPARCSAFLKKRRRPRAQNADQVLAAGLLQARTEKKADLLHFGRGAV